MDYNVMMRDMAQTSTSHTPAMLPLLGGTVFMAALLLFWVQPLFSKMLLPALGGSPSVWNTTLLFYQAALFAGYLYAHLLTRGLAPGRQFAVHLALIALAALTLPVSVPAHDPDWAMAHPRLWLLKVLCLRVGPAFVLISATSPLIQSWLASTTHRDARDPYYLYAASNAGNMAALAAFVFALEPRFTLTGQSAAWAVAYLAFAAVMAPGMAYLRKHSAPAQHHEAASPAGTKGLRHNAAAIVVLTFIPTSLLYGVTFHASMNISATPLVWTVPLFLYLLAFVLAFMRGRRISVIFFRIPQLVLIAIYSVLFMFTIEINFFPIWVVLPLNMLLFFVGAAVCLYKAADLRPATGGLTAYYLLISGAGMLAGVFNVLIAPALFKSDLEYTFMLAAAAGAGGAWKRGSRWADLAAAATALAVFAAIGHTARGMQVSPAMLGLRMASAAGVVLIVIAARGRALMLGLCIAAVLAGGLVARKDAETLLHERNFFGIYKVIRIAEEDKVELRHGTITHGFQITRAAERYEPRSYYARDTPLGDIFELAHERGGIGNVGAVGLGTGTVAAYAREGQRWEFHELDPLVVRMAREHFTYLADSKAEWNVYTGDGRLTLARVPDGAYDLLIVDTFLSDSIPIHMATTEAVNLYARKLAPNGIIAFHISNLHMDLAPVLHHAAIGEGLSSTTCSTSSAWFVMTRDTVYASKLSRRDGCRSLGKADRTVAWTDERSSVLDVIMWRFGR